MASANQYANYSVSAKDVHYPKYTFFWKSASPFSQWHNSTFIAPNGITYNCAEQYMMHQKAVLFGDDKTASSIMKTKQPRQQKSLGRKVKNFKEDVWQANCQRIVKEGNWAKFLNNKKLKKALYDTAGTTLVEASPFDTIWGIGLAESDLAAHNKDTWRGQNLLGYILTDVRDEMMAQEDKQGKRKYTFFWRKSIFHQWHPSEFTLDGIKYNCSEQYMMYQKAVFFEDEETAAKILNEADPEKQKSLGREVKNFDAEKWKLRSYDIVKAGNQAKFEQNPKLQETLLDTAGTVLVEANPNDTIWGIGLSEDDPLASNPETWRGQNLLGQLLTEIREQILAAQIM